MLISDWQPNYQWKWWRNTSRLMTTRLQHRVCLKVFHKVGSWICGCRCDSILLQEENQGQNFASSPAKQMIAIHKTNMGIILFAHVSTKLEIVSPLLVFIDLWFISCNSNFLFGKRMLFWDMLLSDLTLCVLCFLSLHLPKFSHWEQSHHCTRPVVHLF